MVDEFLRADARNAQELNAPLPPQSTLSSACRFAYMCAQPIATTAARFYPLSHRETPHRRCVGLGPIGAEPVVESRTSLFSSRAYVCRSGPGLCATAQAHWPYANDVGLGPLTTTLSMRIVRISRQHSPELQGVDTWMDNSTAVTNLVLRGGVMVEDTPMNCISPVSLS